MTVFVRQEVLHRMLECFLLLKDFMKKKYNSTHKNLTGSVRSITVCLLSSDGGLWGLATCEMNQCALWSSQWLDRQMVMVV